MNKWMVALAALSSVLALGVGAAAALGGGVRMLFVWRYGQCGSRAAALQRVSLNL